MCYRKSPLKDASQKRLATISTNTNNKYLDSFLYKDGKITNYEVVLSILQRRNKEQKNVFDKSQLEIFMTCKKPILQRRIHFLSL